MLPLPKIEFGKCPFCKKEILKKDKDDNPVKLEGYSEFWVLLSNKTRMKVAICDSCKKELKKKDAEAVVSVHCELWADGIKESYDRQIEQLKKDQKREINNYSNLKLVKHGLRERDLE